MILDGLGNPIQVDSEVYYITQERRQVVAVVKAISQKKICLYDGIKYRFVPHSAEARIPTIIVKTASTEKISFDQVILMTVCDYFGIGLSRLRSKSRKREDLIPRQICIYLLLYYRYPPSLASKALGYLTPAIVGNSQKKVQDAIDTRDSLYTVPLSVLIPKLNDHDLSIKPVFSKQFDQQLGS